MKGLIVRYRKSDYTKTIFPFDEDREYWYVTEFVDKTIPETLRYSKRQFDFIGEKQISSKQVRLASFGPMAQYPPE
jgi:hypothetical protein